MATFPAFDLSRLDLTQVRLPKVDLPRVDLPMPDLSSIPFPLDSLPKVNVPAAEQVTGFARDAGYIGVGLVVLGVQQAQVRRRDLASSVRSGLEHLRDAVA